MKITSTQFDDGGGIPVEFTCDGEDVPPPLQWSGVPPQARFLALICDDPDAPAGTWVHWVLYNLPAGEAGLPGGTETRETLPDGTSQGRNDFGRTGYGGPCPPPGGPHRYYFTLYALDAKVPLVAGATKAELLAAVSGHVLAEAQLMGTYRRAR